MFENVVYYKTSLSVFKQWRANGIITEAELAAAEERIATKYGLPSGSIYRERGDADGNRNQEQSVCV